MKLNRFVVAGLLLISAAASQAEQPVTPSKPSAASGIMAHQILMPGRYTAKVKALVCDMCAPEVEETLGQQKELEKISVDQKTSTASFSVKQGSQISLGKLQQVLKDASAKMGMGADYTLHDIKPAGK